MKLLPQRFERVHNLSFPESIFRQRRFQFPLWKFLRLFLDYLLHSRRKLEFLKAFKDRKSNVIRSFHFALRRLPCCVKFYGESWIKMPKGTWYECSSSSKRKSFILRCDFNYRDYWRVWLKVKHQTNLFKPIKRKKASRRVLFT